MIFRKIFDDYCYFIHKHDHLLPIRFVGFKQFEKLFKKFRAFIYKLNNFDMTKIAERIQGAQSVVWD